MGNQKLTDQQASELARHVAVVTNAAADSAAIGHQMLLRCRWPGAVVDDFVPPARKQLTAVADIFDYRTFSAHHGGTAIAGIATAFEDLAELPADHHVCRVLLAGAEAAAQLDRYCNNVEHLINQAKGVKL